MGCKQSKEATAGGSNSNNNPSSSHAAAKSKNPIPIVLEGLKNNRTSVIDQVFMMTHMVKETATTVVETVQKARHMPNIFATPLEHIDSATYKPPHYAKTKEEQDFIRDAISRNFVFSTVPASELDAMIGAFEPISYSSQDVILQQGDSVGDFAYVLKKGQVKFLVQDQEVGIVGPGHAFGELALLYRAPRAATCVALSDSTDLYRVDSTTFRYILQTQMQTATTNKRDLLRGIPFLQDLDPADLAKLADNMTPRTFEKGDVIVTKGTVGDAFYVLQEGTIQVQDIEVGGKTYENMTLGPGEYFGERAIVTREPRTANCIATTSGIALCVDSDTFSKVMGNMSQLILKASDKRQLEALTVFRNTNLDSSDYTSLAELVVDKTFTKGQVLFQEGSETNATLYFVRGGEVQLTSASKSDESHNKVINQGGVFGEDMLQRDAHQNANAISLDSAECIARYTATVSEDCTLGILTLEECRTVFDTSQMGKTRPFQSIKGSQITMESLKRHKILGAGTFGQVWLVSRLASDGKSRKAYALKIQSKYELVRNSQARGVVQEKNIMAKLHHPFIINLVTTYQDTQRVYMLMGLVQGGELFGLMNKAKGNILSEHDTKFYSAGMLEGLGHMHRRHILYRDLKPENVLLDDAGYPVIVDLGFAKYVKEKTYTLCGTPLYIAPEVIMNRGHDKGADHWSLACMIYEMMCGTTPFYRDGMDQISLFRAVVKGKFQFPKSRSYSEEWMDLIRGMLEVVPNRRLGSLAGGSQDLYRAPWFSSIQFSKLKSKAIPAPWVPKIKDPLDCSNFENWDHLQDKGKMKDPPISKKDEAIFLDF